MNDRLGNRRVVDHDIRGVVGIRLINPTDSDVKAVYKQIGQPCKPLNREPDIIIRFFSKLPISQLKFLGLTAGFDVDGYYILKSSKAPAKVQIPFEKIGDVCEMNCESGLRSIPLLIAIINLTFLKKGYLALHASAFEYNKIGCVVMGWSKGGKTEALLSFANHGASYVADEWTIFSNDGNEMFGITEPVRLWDWQFKYIPNIENKISRQKKILFKIIHLFDYFYKIMAFGKLKKFFLIKILGESLPAFKRQLNVLIPPKDIFGDRFCPSSKPEKLFLIMSHNRPDISISQIDAKDIINRMRFSNEVEQIPFFEHYKTFKFAFPDRKNEFLEKVDEIQYELLKKIFKEKESYQVLHPYPVNFSTLYNGMKDQCFK